MHLRNKSLVHARWKVLLFDSESRKQPLKIPHGVKLKVAVVMTQAHVRGYLVRSV